MKLSDVKETHIYWTLGIIVVGAIVVKYVVDTNPKPFAGNNINHDGMKFANADGSGLTFPQSSYDDFATQIFNAENGCATDSATVLGIYAQMKTPADLQQLSNSFGTRSWDKCWVNHPSCAMFGTLSMSGSLQDFLNYNLSSSDLVTISQCTVQNGAAGCGGGANPFS